MYADKIPYEAIVAVSAIFTAISFLGSSPTVYGPWDSLRVIYPLAEFDSGKGTAFLFLGGAGRDGTGRGGEGECNGPADHRD
jgi:hypothetical protein